MKTKLKFKVVSRPSLIARVEDVMKHMDLGIQGIAGYENTEMITVTTTTKVDRKYINGFKKVLKEAYENSDREVISINKIK